jgi:enterochelin esterase-like enzyme
MIKKETIYHITLDEIQAIKLLNLLIICKDGEHWNDDFDLNRFYDELYQNVDTDRFNQFMESGVAE